MKTYFLLLTLLFAFSAQATVRIVNGGTNVPGQYIGVSDAITASSNGDTIYITPTGGTYLSVTLNKSLVIIGSGYNPDKQNPLISRIQGINLAVGSSGSQIHGLYFTNVMTCSLAGNVSITFQNCQFNNSTITFNNSVVGIIFNGCLFTNTGVNNFTSSNDTVNFALNNCIFNSPISSNISSTWSGQISNCNFLGSGSTAFITNVYNMLIFYSIFYGTNPTILGTNNQTTEIVCLSYNASNNNFNGTTLGSNFVNVNPLFTSYSPPGFSFTHNYRLQAASPAKTSGWLGTEIGVYGNVGSTASTFKMSGEPTLVPVIREMNMGATTVVAGTPINVNVISTVKP